MTLSIDVYLNKQQLHVYDSGDLIANYSISSALNGAGEEKGSERTPRGKHIIRAKIGADAPLGAVFVGRRFTGEVYTPELAESQPERDWILTRILWLSGCEVGKNRLAGCDSMQRYIYIHGTPLSEPMGTAKSHGCIRMRNSDVLHLFNLVPVYTQVYIHE